MMQLIAEQLVEAADVRAGQRDFPSSFPRLREVRR